MEEKKRKVGIIMKIDERLIAAGSFLIAYFIMFAIVLAFKKKIYGKMEYDERQERVRGVAYKRGFFVLLFGIIINSMVKEVLEVDWATPMTEMAIFMLIAIVVVSGTCIFQDAYFAPFAKGKNIVLVSAVVGAINLFSGIKKFFAHQNLDEFHRFSNIQLILGVVLIIIPVMAFIHGIMEERGGEE